MIKIDNFTFVEAESDELKEAVFRLRYKVFSVDSKILKESDYDSLQDFREGIERDVFDSQSLHFAALNKDNDVVGALRLVLHSKEGFPIQHWARNLGFIGEKPPPQRIAEISRLAVDRQYRRRQEDGLYGVESHLIKSEGGVLPNYDTGPKELERRKRPVIVLGLYRAMYHASKKRNKAPEEKC